MNQVIPEAAVEEQFCDRCWAGMESNEHHEKCEVTPDAAHDNEGER